MRIVWDEKAISADQLVQWIREEYPVDLWCPWISTSEPMMFPDLMVESVFGADRISNRIGGEPFVKSTATQVASSNMHFEKLTEIKLREMLSGDS